MSVERGERREEAREETEEGVDQRVLRGASIYLGKEVKEVGGRDFGGL